ncbi:curli production assembly/transport component CsgF [Hymenobacter sp. BRD67]|uniref:curli production assembly/transport component CsgF n=1 Tax=Hymenobacter sp. BRD67 TaxID=2675877 RepID=UPI0015676037|nr:curli production assembly/transport component CsgF [Hymenobacter sp. BRD67]QKG53945.1 curli assembly protein CsgF [Hymenobacter sp. BRD67]
MKKVFSVCLLLGVSCSAHAQRFVYTPINPSFGGNTFNGSWLQAAATAQNRIADPSTSGSNGQTDPLTQFSANLNQQVLSQLTNRLLTSQFGQGAIKAGSYTVGTYQVNVSPGGGGLIVVVTDTGTGNKTTITIPSGL